MWFRGVAICDCRIFGGVIDVMDNLHGIACNIINCFASLFTKLRKISPPTPVSPESRPIINNEL
jgi:hypothetical protein